MSFARISPTPSTASSSASVAASSSSRPPNSATICGDDQLGQARDPPQHAVAARRDGVVERVELAVVAEQLGEAAEVEQVLVGEPADLLERGREALVGVARTGSRARAPPSRRRRRPSSPRAASRSGAPRCRARRCSARSRPPCASRAPSAAAPSARRAASSPPSNSSAVRRVETWSRRVRYLSSVASAWLALASTTGMSSRMYLTPSTYTRDDLAALGDRDHERVGLLGDALGRAVAGAGLVREDRRVRHQLDVGHRDLRRVRVEDDRAVHLRHLVEERRRVVDLELDPAGVQEAEILGLADHDQAARARVQDALDALPQRGARERSSPEPS